MATRKNITRRGSAGKVNLSGNIEGLYVRIRRADCSRAVAQGLQTYVDTRDERRPDTAARNLDSL